MKYDPAAYYYYTIPSGKMGMARHGVFTRDKSRWLEFWGYEVERLVANKIRPYGTSRKGVFIPVEETANQTTQQL